MAREGRDRRPGRRNGIAGLQMGMEIRRSRFQHSHFRLLVSSMLTSSFKRASIAQELLSAVRLLSSESAKLDYEAHIWLHQSYSPSRCPRLLKTRWSNSTASFSSSSLPVSATSVRAKRKGTTRSRTQQCRPQSHLAPRLAAQSSSTYQNGQHAPTLRAFSCIPRCHARPLKFHKHGIDKVGIPPLPDLDPRQFIVQILLPASFPSRQIIYRAQSQGYQGTLVQVPHIAHMLVCLLHDMCRELHLTQSVDLRHAVSAATDLHSLPFPVHIRCP